MIFQCFQKYRYLTSAFERPDWKRLIADIEAGEIECVIAKDMSRIGRDYLQVGFYTEVMFREKGVRFIAIANGVDSQVQNSNEFAPFLNIMNEWYLRDCSRKVKSAYRVKGMAGKHLANNSVYGYKKDPADKDHWLIDEEAADVVRRIFRLTVEGVGPYDIARILHDEKIERPSHYLAKRGRGVYQNRVDEGLAYMWNGETVRKILSRPEYMGHTVNFRTTKENYKDKQRKINSPEDWVIFENTQEAIVDERTWHLAQSLRHYVRRTDTIGEANPLTGLMYCADCGAKMYNHRHKGGTYEQELYRDKNGNLTGKCRPDLNIYTCSGYCKKLADHPKKCTQHFIRTAVVRELLLEAIRSVSKYAIENEKEFVKKVRETLSLKQQSAVKALQSQLRREQKRCQELDSLIKKLYEDYALGKMPEKRYELLSAEYEQEQAGLVESIAKVQAELAVYDAESDKLTGFMALVSKYTDFSELTTPMINEFIDKILVHEADKSSGERVQEVEIYFKFIGKFEAPQPEPTPEELAAAEKERQRRAKNREYQRRSEERREQRLLQELAEQEKQNQIQTGN